MKALHVKRGRIVTNCYIIITKSRELMTPPTVGLNKIKRKNGFVYQIDFTFNGIRKREVVGKNKKEAQLIQAKIQTDFTLGNYDIPLNKEAISFDTLSKEYLFIKKNSLSESSITRYKEYLRQFNFFFSKYFPFVLKNISLINASYIVESIEHLTTKGTDEGRIWTDSTANSYRTLLASIFKYAVKKEYLKKNPVSDISQKKVEAKIYAKYYTPEEVNQIISNSSEEWSRFYNFILNTGLRSKEMLNLLWENVEIDASKSKIFVISVGSLKTKTHKGRFVPINTTALGILKEQKKIRSNFVFNENNGKQIKKNRPLYVLQRKLEKLSIKGDIHQFRHTFATRYICSGAGTLYNLKELLGHKDIKTTQIYAHLSDEYLRETLNKLG